MRKILLLLSCLQFVVFLAAAQTADSLVINQVDSLISICDSLRSDGDIQNAMPIAVSAKDMAFEELGVKHPSYVSSLNNLGVLYIMSGSYEPAETLLVEAKNIAGDIDKEHPIYVESLNSLANLYQEMGRYKDAQPLYLEAKNIIEKLDRTKSSKYVMILNNLGGLNLQQGRYEAAEPLYLQAKDIIAKIEGVERPEYAWILSQLANLYLLMGRYETAEPLYLQAKNIIAQVFGKEHLEAAGICYNLAILYSSMGYYEEAETQYSAAGNIWGRVLGKKHPYYVQTLNSLGDLYSKTGRYGEAELLLIETRKIWEEDLGKEHPNYATNLNNLGGLYYEMGFYQEAEKLYSEAKDIREKVLGKEHPGYAQSLNNLALVNDRLKRYREAETLYLEAISIHEKALGKDHPDYAVNLINLASLYYETERYEEAETLYLEAKNIQEKVIGNEHPDYATNLNNLGSLYYQMGRYEESETMYLEAKNIRGKVLGEEHPEYVETLSNLAKLYDPTESPEKAIPLIEQADAIRQKLIETRATHLSEIELEDYVRLFSEDNDFKYSFALRHNDPLMAQAVYQNTLFYKGFLLENVKLFRKLLLQVEDDSTRLMANRWKGLHRRISQEKDNPEKEPQKVLELEERANRLEKELLRQIPDLAGTRKQFTWQEVRDSLRPGEAAVEFVHFRYHNPKPTDSTLYAALVLRKEYDHPKFVYLFEEGQLREQMLQPVSGPEEYISFVYRGKSGAGTLPANFSKLYQLIWQPLERLLEGVDVAWYSPSGLLHRISFPAVAKAPDQCLLDMYEELNYIGSSRELAIRKGALFAEDIYTGVVYGDISYRTDSLKLAAAVSNTDPDLNVRTRATPIKSEGFGQLPGTLAEMEMIERHFKKEQKFIMTLQGYEASEESFKSFGRSFPSPDLIHPSTHGFFEEDCHPNPMFCSGLLFAGSDTLFKGGAPIAGFEDGILYAYEVSNLNLSNTKVVILSACETGLGEIRGGEGVYGLQRAFKIAGVDYLIMSLWKIGDSVTAEFMSAFYQDFFSGKEVRAAFWEAQKKMRAAYPDEPFKWAGFILI